MTQAAATEPRLRLLDSFAAPELDAGAWDALLAAGATDSVFLTHAWQTLWWRAFGDERLLIVLAEREGEPLAIAPLYAVEGSIAFVGSGGSDHLDVIGRPDATALAAMLAAARDATPGFAGFELYHLPLDSPTTAQIPRVAELLGLEYHREDALGAPFADLADEELVVRLTGRRSIRKEEARMRRAGTLEVRTAGEEELEELLELFLAQHGARWEAAGQRSFDRRGSRSFLRAAVLAGHRDGWARLTLLEWQGRPVALDIGLLRGSTQLSWQVSRDPTIRGYSPGRVLGAHVVRDAVARGIRRFDFGLGEEEHKLRDISGVMGHANWFLYP